MNPKTFAQIVTIIGAILTGIGQILEDIDKDKSNNKGGRKNSGKKK